MKIIDIKKNIEKILDNNKASNITSINLKNKSYINWVTIGETNLGRPIWVLDITKGTPTDKPLLLFFTRQHPPEVTGYFAFKSFVEELINNNPVAELFLNKYRVLAFPLVNPDGVDLGHWRHNASGIDTCLLYTYPSPRERNRSRMPSSA